MFDDIFDDGQIVVPYILIPRCNKQTNKQKGRKMCHKVLENFPYKIHS